MNENIKTYVHQFLHPPRNIYAHGTVAEIKPKRLAVVECPSKTACSGCGAAGKCCQSASSGGRRIMADNIPCARLGDKVKVEIETSAGILDSETVQYSIAFVMLALGLGLGYGIAKLLVTGISAALLALLIGAAFMTGIMGVLRFGRQGLVQTAMARIVEIEEIAEKDKP